ncbi:imm11 family protein [Vibrio olivae]
MRDYEYTKLKSGPPLFFENAYKDKDLSAGIKRPIKLAHMNITYPIISEGIKNSLGSIENDNFQFYPAIIIDDTGKYFESFWFFNVFEQLDVLDLELCDIDDYDPEDDMHDIEKYYLSDEKMSQIPEGQRLVFMPKYGDVGHIMVHESIVKVFKKHNVDTLNFVKVSEWKMGKQFID